MSQLYPNTPDNQAKTMRDLSNEIARKHGLDPNLVNAIITVESAWDPWAIRYENNWKWHLEVPQFAHKSCITERTEYILQSCSFGLMQLVGAVARELGFVGKLTCLLDPVVNIEFGCLKLKSLMNKYNDLDDVIASYNAGSPSKDPVLHRYTNQTYVTKVKYYLDGKTNA